MDGPNLIIWALKSRGFSSYQQQKSERFQAWGLDILLLAWRWKRRPHGKHEKRQSSATTMNEPARWFFTRSSNKEHSSTDHFILALWDSKKRPQFNPHHAQISDPKRLWHNKYRLFKPLSLWWFVLAAIEN